MKNIVVIGGGTGTFTVLSGLKKFDNLNLTAIVNVTDSGGSTGRLRDEYGFLPVGDIRQALVALADAKNGDTLLRKLFLYRFDRGELEGHNFGNLFLTAMTDILGSEQRAIRYASQVLRIKGTVLPICNKDVDLVAEYENGTTLVGEANIDEPDEKHDKTSRITSLKIQPTAHISKRAKDAILKADFVILGPGDLYSSLLSNFAVGGTVKALSDSKAKFIYITNLMTKYGQTHDLSAQGHVDEVVSYVNREPDYVLIHNKPIPKEIQKKYLPESAYPVEDDLGAPKNVIRTNIASTKVIKQNKQDFVNRSIMRHDSTKLAKVLLEIFEK